MDAIYPPAVDGQPAGASLSLSLVNTSLPAEVGRTTSEEHR
jgi:hypothetical protein